MGLVYTALGGFFDDGEGIRAVFRRFCPAVRAYDGRRFTDKNRRIHLCQIRP